MKPPFDHFDFIAPWYDRLIGRPAHDPLADLLGVEAGQWLIDIGGGTGRNSRGLSALGAHVVICDLSAGMARQARRRGVLALRGNVVHLPFRSDSADHLLVVDAFHHFVQPSPKKGSAFCSSSPKTMPDDRRTTDHAAAPRSSGAHPSPGYFVAVGVAAGVGVGCRMKFARPRVTSSLTE